MRGGGARVGYTESRQGTPHSPGVRGAIAASLQFCRKGGGYPEPCMVRRGTIFGERVQTPPAQVFPSENPKKKANYRLNRQINT